MSVNTKSPSGRPSVVPKTRGGSWPVPFPAPSHIFRASHAQPFCSPTYPGASTPVGLGSPTPHPFSACIFPGAYSGITSSRESSVIQPQFQCL